MDGIQEMNDPLRFAGTSQLQSRADITDQIADLILDIGGVQEKRAATEQRALSPLDIFEMIIY